MIMTYFLIRFCTEAFSFVNVQISDLFCSMLITVSTLENISARILYLYGRVRPGGAGCDSVWKRSYAGGFAGVLKRDTFTLILHTIHA